MRVDHVLAQRPLEHGEAAVLRRDERDGVPLILRELRRRQVSRAAELRRMHEHRLGAFDRLGERHLFHLRRIRRAARSSRRRRAGRSDR